MGMKKIKVALIDDHAVVRMGLRYALSLFKDIELAGELDDGEGAAKLVKETGADVTLLDIRMPGKDGIATLGEILAADPAAKVVMLTTSAMEEDIYAALNAGGYKGAFAIEREAGDNRVADIALAATRYREVH